MISVKPTAMTVTELNGYVKSLLDSDIRLQSVFIKGEISNYKAHYSGHRYFTLKDSSSSVKAVMFASAASGLKFAPGDGMSVLIIGRISLYPRDGAYQLYADEMYPDGAGELAVAFEQLKSKLDSEGLFSPERKKPIPFFPLRVGVITSPTGAAVRDIINVLNRRCPQAEVVLCPAKVQGEGAAQSIAEGIRLMNERKAADVIIVGRGGGSIEDLWAFNEEAVARAVAESVIPVISAVGHETDFTICDFAADLRAPTPSAAAELAVPDTAELRASLSALGSRLLTGVNTAVAVRRERLDALKDKRVFRSSTAFIDTSREELDRLSELITTLTLNRIESSRLLLAALAGRINSLDPLSVLRRGYAAVYDSNNTVISTVSGHSAGEIISIRLSDGTLNAQII